MAFLSPFLLTFDQYIEQLRAECSAVPYQCLARFSSHIFEQDQMDKYWINIWPSFSPFRSLPSLPNPVPLNRGLDLQKLWTLLLDRQKIQQLSSLSFSNRSHHQALESQSLLCPQTSGQQDCQIFQLSQASVLYNNQDWLLPCTQARQYKLFTSPDVQTQVVAIRL